MSKSDLEALLGFQLTALGLAPFETEFRFHPTRKWRLDVAWPQQRVAVAVQGGIWTGGRHVTGKGYEKDCEKYSAAAVLGWRIIFAAPRHIESGEAATWAEEALAWT